MNTEGFVVNETLKAPKKHKNIPAAAKWLGGEGAGSWFYIKKKEQAYSVTRFSPTGVKECEGVFITLEQFNLDNDYEMAYLSHCAEVNVVQNNKKIQFSLTQKLE